MVYFSYPQKIGCPEETRNVCKGKTHRLSLSTNIINVIVFRPITRLRLNSLSKENYPPFPRDESRQYRKTRSIILIHLPLSNNNVNALKEGN